MDQPMIMGLSVGLAVAVVGFLVSYFAGKKVAASERTKAEAEAKSILAEAEKKADAVKRTKIDEADDKFREMKRKFESERDSKDAKLRNFEKELRKREEGIEQKLDELSKKEKKLSTVEADVTRKASQIDGKVKQIDELLEEQNVRLERITGMSKEDAKKFLIDNMVNDAKADAAQLVKDVRDEAKVNARKEAQRIVLMAIQRTASDHCVESTVSVVNLQSEEMKGRIIGREGRNIRAFEAATGIDLIIDETPETVTLSSFDPLRREVARVALLKLMADGRINPARIEELVQRAGTEVEAQLREDGERAAYEAGVSGLHPELFKILGRLKFRSSYGQNQLQHSLEVSLLAGTMAAEVGADVATCRRAGLLHDIGKALAQAEENAHAAAGAEFARKLGIPPRVVHAIAAHHFETDPQTVEAFLVAAADAISAARPGARRETAENYVRRLQDLELVAASFPGVDRAYALQAGREVRILVRPDEVDDVQVAALGRDIVKRIGDTLDFPGLIRVTVIRETRVTDYAR